MRVLVFLLASFACGSCKHKRHSPLKERQHSRYLTNPSSGEPLAKLLLTFNPTAGWQAGGPGNGAFLLARNPHSLQAHRAAKVLAMAEKEKTEDKKGWVFDGDEFILNVFKMFGGKIEDEPAGLKRATVVGTPDYLKATSELADPVEGDEGEVKVLRCLLKATYLEKMDLRLAYDANRDGWNAQAFHAGVDYQGPILVAAKTKGGAYCGGYAPVGFIGLGEERNSIAAFVWSWPDGDTSKKPIKLTKQSGGDAAVLDYRNTGPRFGYEGFSCKMDPYNGADKTAISRLGLDYAVMPDKRRSIFAREEGTEAELTELRAYVGVWSDDEPIPYAGPLYLGFR